MANISLFIGGIRPLPESGRPTGMYKTPVTAPIALGAEGFSGDQQADRLLAKMLKLRIFADAAGKMNLSLQDVAGGLLIVSQFTLAADTTSGNRPGFSQAATPAEGERLYDYFVAQARAVHPQVATGRFGADMQVHLVNDGPVTIPLRMVPTGT